MSRTFKRRDIKFRIFKGENRGINPANDYYAGAYGERQRKSRNFHGLMRSIQKKRYA